MRNKWLDDRMDREKEDNRPILDKQTPETLAVWWCMLNSHKWPDELLHAQRCGDKLGLGWEIMELISERISQKELLRMWNVYPEKWGGSLSMKRTEQWFESFWEGRK